MSEINYNLSLTIVERRVRVNIQEKNPTLFSCTINLIDYRLKKKTSLLLAASMLKTEKKNRRHTPHKSNFISHPRNLCKTIMHSRCLGLCNSFSFDIFQEICKYTSAIPLNTLLWVKSLSRQWYSDTCILRKMKRTCRYWIHVKHLKYVMHNYFL